MKRRHLFLMLGAVGAAAIIMMYGVYYIMLPFDRNDRAHSQRICFKKSKKCLFARAEVRGGTGEHQEIILSDKPIKDRNALDLDSVYVFYTSEIFYKEKSDSEIVVYAVQSSIREAKIKFGQVAVTVRPLKDHDKVSEYNYHYKKYGLQKISTLR